jgi:hypothetical protein
MQISQFAERAAGYAQEFSHLKRRQPVAAEIQHFIEGVIHQAA